MARAADPRSGVAIPASSAASATIILKVEPGGYCPAIALFISGARGSVVSARQTSRRRPLANPPGSNDGTEASARTSPLCTSSTTALALSSPARRSVSMALQLEVDGEAEVAARLAVPAVELLDLAAERVDLVAADPGAAAQDLLVGLLDAVLADPELGQLEQRIAGQLALRDRADIAEHDAP